MGTIDIQKAMEMVRERGLFQGVTRYTCEGFDIKDCLELVETIGKERNPRFVIDDENRFAYENFVKWLHCDPTMKALNPETKKEEPGDLKRGIYIAGNTGTGKSWVMDVMRAYAEVFNLLIDFGDGNKKRIRWKTYRADAIVSEFVETLSIEKFRSENILCIQDMGSEPIEAVAMGNRMNVLKTLIESRGDRSDCITFITSNYSLKNPALSKMYGDRVISRLLGMCNYFEIKGSDRRIS